MIPSAPYLNDVNQAKEVVLALSAQRKQRIRALAVLTLATALGVTLLTLMEHHRDRWEIWLAEYLEAGLEQPWITGLILGLPCLPLLLFSGYLFRLGGNCIRRQQYPPVGVMSLSSKKGHAAILRGRWLQVLALLLGVASIFLPLVLGYNLYRLGGG